ncbi:MAG: flagellar hook-length control protein FliK [Desulfatibacillum sp.]|nr:flagellar hook-length control protein FliK [Desulfatibacillum sp.]
MITQMLAANGFLDGIVSSRARTGKQGDFPGQGLFSSLLTRAKNSLEGQATGATRIESQGPGNVEQLKEKMIRSGAPLDEITLEPESGNHVRALLLLDGYSPDQVEEIMTGFGEDGVGMKASVLFSRISQQKPADAILQQARTLEVSAIPHLETALFMAGLDAEQSKDIINKSLTEDGKISLEKLVQNLKMVLGDVEQAEPSTEMALGIVEALNQAGISLDGLDTAPTGLKDLVKILEGQAMEDIPGLPKITRARFLSHLNGVVNNSVVEEEEGEGLVPLSKLTESKLKFFDEEDFEDVPAMYVEMALRRMGLESAEAGRIASQVSAGGAGKGRVLVENLGAAGKFKESLPTESVPAFERLLQEMARNGKLNETELNVADFSRIFASMDPHEAMAGINLKGSDELETLAALLTHSLQSETKGGASSETTPYLEKISVPQTLVELQDLLQGLAKSGKTLPRAAVKDLAEVLKQAGAEPTLVDGLITQANTAQGEVDPAKLAKSIEKVAQSVLVLAAQEADAKIDTAVKTAELSHKFAGIMQVLQNTRSGFLSDDATQYIAKALEDMGVKSHEINQALSQNRFPARGVDPVPVIEVVKKIAQRMGIDSNTITEASIRTGIQDPDAGVVRVESKGQTFGFSDQETARQGMETAIASSAARKGAEQGSSSPVQVAQSGQGKAGTLTLAEAVDTQATSSRGVQEAGEGVTVTGDAKVTDKASKANETQAQVGASTAKGMDSKPEPGIVRPGTMGEFASGSPVKNAPVNTDSPVNPQNPPKAPEQMAEGREGISGSAKANSGVKRPEIAPEAQAGVKAQANAKPAQGQPEVVVQGGERVHHQGGAAAGSNNVGQTTQVKTVENVQMENRDGQRVQVKTNEVYIQAQAGADTAETVEEALAGFVKGAAGLQADLGASQANRENARNAATRAVNSRNAQGQKAVETGDSARPVTENAGAKADPQFVETLEKASAGKAGVENAVRSGGNEADLDAKINVKASMAQDKGFEMAESQAAAGKGTAAPQGNETQGTVHSYQQEAAQAARAGETIPERPVLRPFEGQMAQQLSGQVVQSLNKQENRIRLQLHPKQLGAVDVNMNLKHNVLTVGMSAETEAVKEILMSHVAELKSALADQGIVVDKIEVTVKQNPEQNLAQQQQGQRRGQQPGKQGGQGNGSASKGFVGLTPPKYEAETGLDLMA